MKNKTSTIKSKVEVVENLGANIIVHCQMGNSRFAVNLSKNSNFNMGTDLTIIIDMAKVHFFDSVFGKLI